MLERLYQRARLLLLAHAQSLLFATAIRARPAHSPPMRPVCHQAIKPLITIAIYALFSIGQRRQVLPCRH